MVREPCCTLPNFGYLNYLAYVKVYITPTPLSNHAKEPALAKLLSIHSAVLRAGARASSHVYFLWIRLMLVVWTFGGVSEQH